MAPPYASRGVLTAFFTLVALCAASTTCTAGVDHPDSDLPGMPLLNVVSQAACGAMCDADPACSIWVYIAPGCQMPVNSESMCYLKQGSPPAVRKESCYCSGNGTHAPPPPPPPPDVPRFTLSNGVVAASLGSRGLVRVTAGAVSVAVTLDAWAVIVDAAVINSTGLPDPVATQAVPGGDVVYAYAPVGASPAYTVTVTYSAAPSGGAFLRKALTIASSTPSVPLVVASIAPFDVLSLQLNSAPVGAVYPSGALGTYGVFLRAADGSGLVAAAENPFLTPSAVAAFSPTGALVRVAYRPDMVWNQSTPRNATPAPFIADAGLIGLYMLSPNAVPPPLERDTSSRLHRVTRLYVAPRRVAAGSPDALATGHYAAHDTARGMLVEFEALGSGGALPVGVHAHRGAPAPDVWLNYAERDAFRALGEAAFNAAHYGGAEPLRVHIPWTENDYQIDIANATQWPEYQRILETLAKIGVERILYAGTNSDTASYAECEDDWCWEPVLWLALGEQLRKGQWAPGSPIPPSVQRLITASQTLGVSAIPYVYPILGFTDNRTAAPWLSKDGAKLYAQLSSREFQDYLVETTVDFSRATSAYGAGYDYTYFWYTGSSQYSQWAGWRRILLSVRAQLGAPGLPQYVVDNRQASHEWSPWMWAAGSYAEPLQSDEQTTSWTAFVQDIHIDRTDGNRQREMNYDYAQSKLCQPSAMPGFMHHNTDRGDGRHTDLSIRDFDFYGAPYSIISAVATGALNMVVCDVPARDAGEYGAFPAIAPDTRTMSVAFYRTWFEFARTYAVHMHAIKFLPQPPAPGVIDGTYAVVEGSGFVFLFNPNAAAASTPDGLLAATAASLDVACTAGSSLTIGELWPFPADALLTVPCGANFSVPLEGRSARVLTVAPSAPGDEARAAVATAARAAPVFVHNQPVAGMGYDPAFAGGRLAGTVRVPAAVFAQLAARGAAYPVPWTPEDAAIAWLNPSRLLASIDVNRAVDSKAVITATLDGAPVTVVPVWSCRNVREERCFQGFSIDLTAAGVQADTDHALVVTLPPMAAGVFLGVHYDNVDTVWA